jgi:hypothetical protein
VISRNVNPIVSNPEGIAAQSPGLAPAFWRQPWDLRKEVSNPFGVTSVVFSSEAKLRLTNVQPLQGWKMICDVIPVLAPKSGRQHWALGRNPFGIEE